MNVRQLQALCAVVASGTVTNAASALFLTQPAVSRLLLQLEAEIGFPLFHRHQGRLWVTSEGETFCREAMRVLNHFDRLHDFARDVKRLRVGFLRVVAMPTLAYGLLPDALAEFARMHGDVEVEVDVRQRKELAETLASEPFDVALVPLPMEGDKIEVSPLMTSRAVCILARGHALAAKTHISAADLDGVDFIAGRKHTLLRTRLDEIFATAGVRPRQVLTAETTIMACELVARGLGVSVVHPLLTAKYPTHVEIRDFAHALDMQYGVALPVVRPRSQLAAVLTGLVRERAASRSLNA
jgi:DNA-binding transcriptional LysR family regulator